MSANSNTASPALILSLLGLSVDGTFGSLLIGLIVSTVYGIFYVQRFELDLTSFHVYSLYGVTMLQSIQYLSTFTRDPKYMQAIVSSCAPLRALSINVSTRLLFFG